MGIYNTIVFKNSKGEDCYIQSKNGDYNMNAYEVSSEIEIPDGIYFGHEGSFVVYLGKVVAAFDESEQHLYDKWDRPLEYPDLQSANPIAQMLKQFQDEYTSNSKET